MMVRRVMPMAPVFLVSGDAAAHSKGHGTGTGGGVRGQGRGRTRGERQVLATACRTAVLLGGNRKTLRSSV
jgi:hypothetical protein